MIYLRCSESDGLRIAKDTIYVCRSATRMLIPTIRHVSHTHRRRCFSCPPSPIFLPPPLLTPVVLWKERIFHSILPKGSCRTLKPKLLLVTVCAGIRAAATTRVLLFFPPVIIVGHKSPTHKDSLSLLTATARLSHSFPLPIHLSPFVPTF